MPTHCTGLCEAGSGSLWHLPHEFSKIVFPWAISSAVDVDVPAAVADVDALGVQETNRMAVNDAAAMSFFMFLILIYNKCNKFLRRLIQGIYSFNLEEIKIESVLNDDNINAKSNILSCH